ncbi:hypothetical protein Golax_015158, partial [Gossypium laxum]|nr:hypothetical protein [Gossypium laxum]
MLTYLNLSSSVFSGQIPLEISKLYRLSSLDLSYVVVASPIPSVLANLSSLTSLYLEFCGMQGMFPLAIFRLPNLETVWLVDNLDLTGSVPPTLGNLTKLDTLDLHDNYFTGFIPSELTNLTQLTSLNLLGNMLHGSVPSSISRLEKLNFFDCDDNRLGGILEMDAFLELKDLQYLFLSLNNFYLVSPDNSNATRPQAQLVDIGLRYCHLREFPYFLRNQHRLQLLDLSSNNIEGQIPQWMSKVSVETLLFLDLSNNSLIGFDDFPLVLPWSKLKYLKLDSNILRGSLPVPPLSTVFYSISNNSLNGEIPQLLCNLSSLSILDFSYNNMSGGIPVCLSNFSKSLLVLKVRSN